MKRGSKQHRINNPSEINSQEIRQLVAANTEVIVQFSGATYSTELLERLNSLCGSLDHRFQIRFYGHYGTVFDFRVLRWLPAVRSLAVDCLQSANHLEELQALNKLHELSLGVFDLTATDILKFPNLRGLAALTLSNTRRNQINLEPLTDYSSLKALSLVGHTKNIAALSQLSALEVLILSQIRKNVTLGFIPNIKNLQVLRLKLGGRSSVEEVAHEGIRELTIFRVMGLVSFTPDHFPSVEQLIIEDQARLDSLRFSGATSRLRRMLLLNCKGLSTISGLETLRGLEELRLHTTGISIDALISKGLPESLNTLALYTGAAKRDREIRSRLDALGYKEMD